MQAKDLLPGQSFFIPNCVDSMRNCICLRVSPTATYITGEERRGINEPWKRFYDYVGNETNVKVDESLPIVEVTRNDRGELGVDSKDLVSSDSVNENGEPKKSFRRGRKRVNVVFPSGEFTVQMVADQNKVSGTNIYQKLMVMVKEGTAKVVREERKEGQRGKPTRIYKLVEKE